MDYVKISRKILDWEWYTDINTKVLFLHILLKANWKPGRFQGTEVPRGSLVTSQQNMAAETAAGNVPACQQAYGGRKHYNLHFQHEHR